MSKPVYALCCIGFLALLAGLVAEMASLINGSQLISDPVFLSSMGAGVVAILGTIYFWRPAPQTAAVEAAALPQSRHQDEAEVEMGLAQPA
jgi:hypothetical protein